MFEPARKIFVSMDRDAQHEIAKEVLRLEKITAAIRHDEALCRIGKRFISKSKPKRVDCGENHSGAISIGFPKANKVESICFEKHDTSNLETRWADPEVWRKHRVKDLKELTPKRLAEFYRTEEFMKRDPYLAKK